jgi:hypothetical protein
MAPYFLSFIVFILQLGWIPQAFGKSSALLAPESCLWSPLLGDKLACSRFTSTIEATDQVAQIPAESSNATSQGMKKSSKPSSQSKPKPVDVEDAWTGPHTCVGVYCVYANPSLQNGHGISLITTARIAQSVAHLPGLDQPPNVDIQAVSKDTVPYRMQSIPGKGMGLVATQPIRRGQRIMAFTPAVLAHLDITTKITSEEQQRLLDVAVEQLPKQTKELYLSQMGFAGGHHVADVMHTNSFGLNLGTEEQARHFGNFPEVSRFNHDCRPK